MKERLKFAEENLDLILDSANNPLDGKRWFLESDEPWLTYSACKEIRNALQCPGNCKTKIEWFMGWAFELRYAGIPFKKTLFLT